MTTTVKGRAAESVAASYLRTQGYRIICNNFRSRFGEIDLICRDSKGLDIIAVEVKSTTDESEVDIRDCIPNSKQIKIRRTLNYYLLLNNLEAESAGMEYILVVYDRYHRNIKQIKHYKNTGLFD